MMPRDGIDIRPVEGRTTFALRGEIDMANAEDLRAALAHVEGLDVPVVLDARDVTLLDSTGLRAVLRIAGSLGGDGLLVVIHRADGLVEKLFDLVMLPPDAKVATVAMPATAGG